MPRTIYVTKRFTFEASHILTKHPGKCRNLHGHSYKLFVTVTAADVNDAEAIVNIDNYERGYFIDFGELTQLVEWLVIGSADHSHLNDLPCMKDKQATAENLAVNIWEELEPELSNRHICLHEIKLYETEDCYVTIRR